MLHRSLRIAHLEERLPEERQAYLPLHILCFGFVDMDLHPEELCTSRNRSTFEYDKTCYHYIERNTTRQNDVSIKLQVPKNEIQYKTFMDLLNEPCQNYNSRLHASPSEKTRMCHRVVQHDVRRQIDILQHLSLHCPSEQFRYSGRQDGLIHDTSGTF